MPKVKNPIPVTRSEAMLAFCHDCMGQFDDGKNDCKCVACPLYQWMPYRTLKPVFVWAEIDNHRIGRHPLNNPEVTITDAEYEAMVRAADTNTTVAKTARKRVKTPAQT